jgi:hypothetical protein
MSSTLTSHDGHEIRLTSLTVSSHAGHPALKISIFLVGILFSYSFIDSRLCSIQAHAICPTACAPSKAPSAQLFPSHFLAAAAARIQIAAFTRCNAFRYRDLTATL